MIKSSINALLGQFDYEVRRKRPVAPAAPAAPVIQHNLRASFHDGLEQIQRLGFQPATILDVGAAHGEFTRAAHALFPGAQVLMLEPLTEFRDGLEKLAGEISGGVLENVAAGKHDGTATFHVHRDWDGSSLYHETEGAQVDGTERTVPLRALDSLVKQYALPEPFLLKIDVQGAELDVLEGGLNTLAVCEYVLLEVTLFQFFVGGPQFADVIHYMGAHNFVAYDVFGMLYRPLDNALSQVDIAFVRGDGSFRQHHVYASAAQRAAQNNTFDTYHARHAMQK